MKSKISLIQGDCLDVMPTLEAGSVDLILTDPPYGTTQCKWDSVIPFAPMWEQLKRVIKPNGAIVLFGSEPFSSALRMSNIKNYKYDWVWDKVLVSGFQVAKYKPLVRHENIIVFGKGRIKYYPEMKKRDKPIKGYATGSKSSPIKYTDRKYRTYTHSHPQSIVVFQRPKRKGHVHPTQKPVALMEYLIKTYTNEGETVLDFTMGSGTTGVACKNLNRNFIGIEKELKYFKIAEKRIFNEI